MGGRAGLALGGLLGLPVVVAALAERAQRRRRRRPDGRARPLGLFFGLILPHGLLELTAVFVAAGAGLRLGWTWIDPGAATAGARRWREEGRAAVARRARPGRVLLVSGVIEAFVTPSPLPTWARIGIGAARRGWRSSPTSVVLGAPRRAGRRDRRPDVAAVGATDTVAA